MRTMYTAVVHRRQTFKEPVLDTAGMKIGERETTSEVSEPFVTDDGGLVEAASAEGIVKLVRDHYEREDAGVNEVVRVWVREVRTVRELSGDELRAVPK